MISSIRDVRVCGDNPLVPLECGGLFSAAITASDNAVGAVFVFCHCFTDLLVHAIGCVIRRT